MAEDAGDDVETWITVSADPDGGVGQVVSITRSRLGAGAGARWRRALLANPDAAWVRRLDLSPEEVDALAAALDAQEPGWVGVRERPAEFAPTSITITSDPYTQAGIRSMWAPGEWKRPPDGRPFYQDANGVMVYARDAGDVVLGLDDNKVSAFVICLGKWFAETGGDLAVPEAARVHVNDVLAFRGVRKHPGGGYQPKQKEAAKEDILFLRDLWVRSHQRVWETTRRGKTQLVDVDVDDPLVEVSVESTVDLWGERTPYAFRFRPGPWARHYLGGPQHWTTSVLKRIMGYHPYSDRLKMRLGLYLTFQWRIRANHGTLGQPWKLKTLLAGAKIEVPARNPQRFFPRVVKALEELRDDGVLAVCEALDFPDWRPPADEPPKRWVPKLLDGRWRLLPAEEVRSRLPGAEPGARGAARAR
jgi:hypothetical protein